MASKAALVRGGQVLSGNSAIENKKKEELKGWESEEPSKEYVTVSTKSGNKEVDMIVVNSIQMFKARRINPSVAASIITGRIRVRFVNAIRGNAENATFGYEVASFRYLDEILFNDLTYVLTTIFQYGSRGTLTLPQIMRMITDTSNIIEYYIPEDDLNDIRNILGVIYSEF